jgi:hypothetical protein
MKGKGEKISTLGKNGIQQYPFERELPEGGKH